MKRVYYNLMLIHPGTDERWTLRVDYLTRKSVIQDAKKFEKLGLNTSIRKFVIATKINSAIIRSTLNS